MQRIEYWFAKCPEGFYKFLKPCEHEKYRANDSWTEELCFSEHEFRTAFEYIGVRYRSINKLNMVVERGDDPFEGKFYLSYVDVRRGMTFYVRNHSVVNDVIANMIKSFEPIERGNSDVELPVNLGVSSQEILIPRTKDSAVLERQIGSSGNENSGVRIYKEAKQTTKQTNKTAAKKADYFSNDNEISKCKKNTAALFLKKDCVIAGRLTETQTSFVLEKLQNLAERLKKKSISSLGHEVEFSLLDVSQFKQCGNDFKFKLNTILKLIKNGHWSTPAALIAGSGNSPEEKQIMAEVSKLDSDLLKLSADISHCDRILGYQSDQLSSLSLDCAEKKNNFLKKIEGKVKLKRLLKVKLNVLKE